MLLDEIAQQYTTIKTKNIVVLAPEEGIYLTMRALLSSGDHVLATAPG